MKKQVIFNLVLFVFLVTPFIVGASNQIKGTSLGEFSSCDYYLIEDSSGYYTLAEWYGGITPYSGNTVVGELHSYGFKDLYNISRDNSTRAYIDDWMLSEDSATEKLIDKCGYHKEIRDYFDSSYTSYTPSTYTSVAPATPSCPTNSSYKDGQCNCNTGYKANGNMCITNTQSCQNTYGINSYGDDQYCYCSSGYQWNTGKTQCIQTPTCLDGYTLINNQCVQNNTTPVIAPKIIPKIEKTKLIQTSKKNFLDDVVLPKQKLSEQKISTPETLSSSPVKPTDSIKPVMPKTPWYKKISNWFKGK